MNKLSERIELMPDGVYTWSASMDREQVQKGYQTGGKIWEIIALLAFLGGGIFSVRYGSWKPFLYMTGFAAVILLISFGVVRGLENWPGGYRIAYRMMDTQISTGHGKKTSLFEFKNTKEMIVGKNYIELRSRFGAFRAYFHEADYYFVRNYIQTRIPLEAKVTEEIMPSDRF